MKRFALKLVLFLLLGAIISVAVAWGCAALTDFKSARPIVEDMYNQGIHWSTQTWTPFGFRRIAFIRSNVMAVSQYRVQQGDASLLQSWRTPAGAIESGPPTIEGRIVDRCGWPLAAVASEQSLRRRVDRRASELIESRNGWVVRSVVDPIMGMTIQRQLPLAPLWPGFAINTIFYAAILWLPFAAFGRIRRRIRAHRGRCTACGYDLRGAAAASRACPECGRPHPTVPGA